MKVFWYVFIIVTSISSAFGWAVGEYVPVQSSLLKRLGYSCLTRNFDMGPMRDGEKKPIPGICGEATCSESAVQYIGCLIPPGGEECELIHGNEDKPYPQCCERVEC